MITIENIRDVLPSIRQHPEFRVVDQGTFTVVDYTHQLPGSFEDQVRRELRGVKLSDRPTLTDCCALRCSALSTATRARSSSTCCSSAVRTVLVDLLLKRCAHGPTIHQDLLELGGPLWNS